MEADSSTVEDSVHEVIDLDAANIPLAPTPPFLSVASLTGHDEKVLLNKERLNDVIINAG